LFAFNKNFISTTDKVDEPEFITFKQLFGVIKKFYEMQVDKGDTKANDICLNEIKSVCQWKLDIDDNILEALLYHKQYDDIVMINLGLYSKFLNSTHGPELFLFGITNGNDLFTKTVLRKNIFDKQIFK
jgi:hypothetical protein